MNTAKRIISIITIGAICIGVTSCAKNASDTNTTVDDKTTVASVKTEEDNKTITKANTKENATAITEQSSKTADNKLAISEKEAEQAIRKKYSDYTVSKNKTEDNVVQFTVMNGNKKYSVVKVDLMTADATETLDGSNKSMIYNLL